MVGIAGFEPATSCSQSKRDTKLRYIPINSYLAHSYSEVICLFSAGYEQRPHGQLISYVKYKAD